MTTTQKNSERIYNLSDKLIEDLSRDANVKINNGYIEITHLSPVTLALSLGYWITRPDEYDLDWLAKFMTDETADW